MCQLDSTPAMRDNKPEQWSRRATRGLQAMLLVMRLVWSPSDSEEYIYIYIYIYIDSRCPECVVRGKVFLQGLRCNVHRPIQPQCTDMSGALFKFPFRVCFSLSSEGYFSPFCFFLPSWFKTKNQREGKERGTSLNVRHSHLDVRATSLLVQ